ncbi:MAG: universal stress protein [Planctomycetaceae bacterium]
MKIVLAVDGSPCSLNAEQVLSKLPLSTSVDLHVVTVCPSADLHAMSSVPEVVQEMIDQCRAQSQKLIDEAAERCRSWCSSVQTELLDGHPTKEVVEAADRLGADLIVVGARGQSAVSRFFLGSVSDGIAKNAHCSVLVVRRDEAAETSEAPEIKRVLLAYDGSPAANCAAKLLASLNLSDDDSIVIHSVIERAPYAGLPVAETVYEVMQGELEPKVKHVAEELRRKTPHVSSVIHVAAHASDDLVAAATKHNSNLVVMGSTGKTVWERLFLGSVTLQVLHHAHCSVWIARPTCESS